MRIDLQRLLLQVREQDVADLPDRLATFSVKKIRTMQVHNNTSMIFFLARESAQLTANVSSCCTAWFHVHSLVDAWHWLEQNVMLPELHTLP